MNGRERIQNLSDLQNTLHQFHTRGTLSLSALKRASDRLQTGGHVIANSKITPKPQRILKYLDSTSKRLGLETEADKDQISPSLLHPSLPSVSSTSLTSFEELDLFSEACGNTLLSSNINDDVNQVSLLGIDSPVYTPKMFGDSRKRAINFNSGRKQDLKTIYPSYSTGSLVNIPDKNNHALKIGWRNNNSRTENSTEMESHGEPKMVKFEPIQFLKREPAEKRTAKLRPNTEYSSNIHLPINSQTISLGNNPNNVLEKKIVTRPTTAPEFTKLQPKKRQSRQSKQKTPKILHTEWEEANNAAKAAKEDLKLYLVNLYDNLPEDLQTKLHMTQYIRQFGAERVERMIMKLLYSRVKDALRLWKIEVERQRRIEREKLENDSANKIQRTYGHHRNRQMIRRLIELRNFKMKKQKERIDSIRQQMKYVDVQNTVTQTQILIPDLEESLEKSNITEIELDNLVASFEKELSRNNEEATKIQKVIRGYLARCFVYNYRQILASIVIQKYWRGYLDRKIVYYKRKQLEFINKCASRIQKWWHFVKNRHKISIMMRLIAWEKKIKKKEEWKVKVAQGFERNGAALRVQVAWKGYKARKMFRYMVLEYKTLRVTQIQRWWRHACIKKKYKLMIQRVKRDEKLLEWAAVKVQRNYRAYRAQKLLKNLRNIVEHQRKQRIKEKKDNMADKIMKVGVGFGGDIALSVNVSKVKRGLKTVQRVAIPKKVREKKEHQAATTIQRIWRGYRARRRTKYFKHNAKEKVRRNRNKRLRAATLKIQGAWRGYQVRKRIRFMRQHYASTIIQSHWRGYRAKCLAYEKRLLLRSVIQIQRAWRGCKIRRLIPKLRREKKRRDVASTRINMAIRQYIAKLMVNKRRKLIIWRHEQKLVGHQLLQITRRNQLNVEMLRYNLYVGVVDSGSVAVKGVSGGISNDVKDTKQVSIDIPADVNQLSTTENKSSVERRKTIKASTRTESYVQKSELYMLFQQLSGNATQKWQKARLAPSIFTRFLRQSPRLLDSHFSQREFDIFVAKAIRDGERQLTFDQICTLLHHIADTKYKNTNEYMRFRGHPARFLLLLQNNIFHYDNLTTREERKKIQERTDRYIWQACITIQKMFRIALAKKKVEQAKVEAIENQEKIRFAKACIRIQCLWRVWKAKKRVSIEASKVIKRVIDPVTSDVYYWNPRTGTVSWEVPLILRGYMIKSSTCEYIPSNQQLFRVMCYVCEERIGRALCSVCDDLFCESCFHQLHQAGSRKNHEKIMIDLCTSCNQQLTTKKCQDCKKGSKGYCDDCYETTHSHVPKNRHRWSPVVISCVECQKFASRYICDMCCDPFCRSCYVKVHSHGKRRYHTYKVDSFNAVVLQERREREKMRDYITEVNITRSEQKNRAMDEKRIRAAIKIQAAWRGMKERRVGRQYLKQKRREMREEYKRRKQEEEEAKKFKNRVKKAAQDMASTLRSKPVADESRGISGVMSRLSLSLRSDQTGKSQTSRGISPMRAMSIFRKTETAETKQTSKEKGKQKRKQKKGIPEEWKDPEFKPNFHHEKPKDKSKSKNLKKKDEDEDKDKVAEKKGEHNFEHKKHKHKKKKGDARPKKKKSTVESSTTKEAKS